LKILFTTFPAKGHLHPLAPLALAAIRAGHEVRVATGSDMALWSEKCGIPAFAVGLTQAEATRAARERYPGADWAEHLFTDVWVDAALPAMLDACKPWRPDLIVNEEEEYAGVLAAALLNIPCVTHSWASPARPLAGRENALTLMGPSWERHLPGTPPRTAGQLYLDSCPPPMQSSDIAGIRNVVNVRPSTFDGPAYAPPGWRPDFPRPAAYFTLGTVPVFSTPERLSQLAHAMAPHFATVVMTTGPNALESLAGLPANVCAFEYLPQSLVLEHVDLVVSQGGAGGTIGALMKALPHLAIPQAAQSQITVSRAIEALGVGISLDEGHRSDAEFGEALTKLKEDPSYSARAAVVRANLMRLPSPREVVRLLEETAETRN
jgi:UDP:flavonoid glycosyltransferase YjiC (YdhE family)